ncbi:MAG: response regulator [Betaproteobacteria bacterium]|nr:response regulator [Betaproteobacteria bacterium]
MDFSLEEKYCSTREAAKLIGVSLRTAQLMVERGELQAWKTSGGHRRILVESVKGYLAGRERRPSIAPEGLSVLIVEDDAITREMYLRGIARWEMPLKVRVAENGFLALLEIGKHTPDLLIADLMMPRMDGFEMIRAIRADPRLDVMNIIAVSAMDGADIQARGGLPGDVALFAKPVPFYELRGFVQAMLSARRRTPAA